MYEAQLEINHFLNRSSKWSSVSRARILEEERENSKDGKFLTNEFFCVFMRRRLCLVSIDHHFLTRYYSHEDGVCKDFLYKGERGNRNRFLTRQTCESSCFEAQDVCELPKARIPI